MMTDDQLKDLHAQGQDLARLALDMDVKCRAVIEAIQLPILDALQSLLAGMLEYHAHLHVFQWSLDAVLEHDTSRGEVRPMTNDERTLVGAAQRALTSSVGDVLKTLEQMEQLIRGLREDLSDLDVVQGMLVRLGQEPSAGNAADVEGEP